MRNDKIEKILSELNLSSSDIDSSALVSIDGLMMSSVLEQGVDEDHVAAMSAAVLSIGERTAMELSRGELEQVLVKGKEGYILVTHAGPDAVITVVAKSSAKLGLVFLDVKRAAKQIEELLK